MRSALPSFVDAVLPTVAGTALVLLVVRVWVRLFGIGAVRPGRGLGPPRIRPRRRHRAQSPSPKGRRIAWAGLMTGVTVVAVAGPTLAAEAPPSPGADDPDDRSLLPPEHGPGRMPSAADLEDPVRPPTATTPAPEEPPPTAPSPRPTINDPAPPTVATVPTTTDPPAASTDPAAIEGSPSEDPAAANGDPVPTPADSRPGTQDPARPASGPGDAITESEDPGAPTSPLSTAPRGPDGAGPIIHVQPGDCLWSIAASQLGPGATDQDIDSHWRRIYALNPEVIGSDPDLIYPGQTLRLPPL